MTNFPINNDPAYYLMKGLDEETKDTVYDFFSLDLPIDMMPVNDAVNSCDSAITTVVGILICEQSLFEFQRRLLDSLLKD